MRFITGFLLVLAAIMPAVPAQAPPGPFFPLKEVRPGMRGIAKTVFEGERIESFQVEILGVLPDRPSPQQSVILGRLSGPQVERTQVFAGMSGSPVYLQDRLLGAIAFAYPFATEAICGITPIQFMLEVGSRSDASTSRPVAPILSASFRELALHRLDWLGAVRPSARMERSGEEPSPFTPAAAMIPIAMPLAVSGISAEALEPIRHDLTKLGFMPVSGVSGGAAIRPLAPYDDQTLLPGSTVSVQLMRGDLAVEGVGTVTYREGTKIYAFGHRLFNLGGTSIPLSDASVVTVVPNAFNSFKVAVTHRTVGSLTQDRTSGVFGELGVAPRMIPVNMTEQRGQGPARKLHFEMVDDPTLSPLLMQLSVLSTFEGGTRSLGDVTVGLKGRIRVRENKDVLLEDRFSRRGMDAALQAGQVAALPLLHLLSSGFPDVAIQGIDLEIVTTESRSAGTLERLWINRTEAGRGDRLQLQIFARTEDGRQFIERIPIEIPRDVPPGPLRLVVADGAAAQALDPTAGVIGAGGLQNLGQLIRMLNRVRRSDRLYVQLLRPGSGAIVNNEELPSLPPSVLATMESNRGAGGYTAIPYVRLKEIEIPPAEFVITGRREITINVIK